MKNVIQFHLVLIVLTFCATTSWNTWIKSPNNINSNMLFRSSKRSLGSAEVESNLSQKRNLESTPAKKHNVSDHLSHSDHLKFAKKVDWVRIGLIIANSSEVQTSEMLKVCLSLGCSSSNSIFKSLRQWIHLCKKKMSMQPCW